MTRKRFDPSTVNVSSIGRLSHGEFRIWVLSRFEELERRIGRIEYIEAAVPIGVLLALLKVLTG